MPKLTYKEKIGNLRKSIKSPDSLAVIFLFASILFFLFFIGTINSGFHFIDDHQMLGIHSDLGKASIIKTMSTWISSDLLARFRPMYVVHRVLEMKIFGADFFALSLYSGILAAFTFSFFYLGARQLKYSVFESLIFVLLAFVGPQMTIWWRLGPSETIAMFFLGLSFFFMGKSADGENYLRNNILFVLFLIAASLSKESCVIIVPAFVFLKIWNESELFGISIKESIRRNLLLIFPIIAMVAELGIIYYVVGTNKLGYAGLIYGGPELIKGILAIVSQMDMLGEFFVLLAFIGIIYCINMIIVTVGEAKVFRKSIKKIFVPLFFSALIVFPNIILYAKSGMVERYLLPATIGGAFFIIYMLKNIDKSYLRVVALAAVLVFALVSLKTAVENASAFAIDGVHTNQLLSAIIENNKPDSTILLVADLVENLEHSLALDRFLEHQGINGLYGYPLARKSNSDLADSEKEWLNWFEGKTINNMDCQPDMIVILDKKRAETFFDQTGISKSSYENILDADNPYQLFFSRLARRENLTRIIHSIEVEKQSYFYANLISTEFPNDLIRVEGLRVPEGPYPQWNLPKVRWIDKSYARIDFESKDKKRELKLTMSFRPQVRPLAKMLIFFNKKALKTYQLKGAENWYDDTLYLPAREGLNTIEFFNEPIPGETAPPEAPSILFKVLSLGDPLSQCK